MLDLPTGIVSEGAQMQWWGVLLAVRRASHDGERKFTAIDLASEARFEDTEASSKEKLAAGWLSKMARWGYVKRSGSAKGESRWIRTFELTEYGKNRKEPGPAPKWAKEK